MINEEPKHVWRAPNSDEPQEVGGVCIICGRYADTDEPCERDYGIYRLRYHGPLLSGENHER